jgi:acyl-CoA reductase-like NAD-dependent aldehyde dehydrogenase
VHLEYFAGLAGLIEGHCQHFHSTRREPFGAVRQMALWNILLKLMARGFAAAVACGKALKR